MGYFMVNTLKNSFYSFLLTIKRFLGVVACIDGDNNNSAFCFCHAFSFHQMATLKCAIVDRTHVFLVDPLYEPIGEHQAIIEAWQNA